MDALAAGRPDRTAIAALSGVERSRRILALDQITRRAAAGGHDAHSPLPPAHEAWRLLATSQRARPEPVARLLALPQVGVWAAHVLRRLRYATEDDTPLWFHLGQLHALAAAAGISAGSTFRIAVPLWNGLAVLPGVGSVQVHGRSGWSHVELVCDGQSLATADGADELRPVRTVVVAPGGPQIQLEELSPYRGLTTPLAPAPLSDSTAERWQGLLAAAWALLARDHPTPAEEIAAVISVVATVPATYRFRPHSASLGEGFGTAIISEPHDATQLAVTLVHELQHSKLNAVNHLAPLTGDDTELDCYAPWRDDVRSTPSLFQGVYAFVAVAEYWSVRRHRLRGPDQELAHFEFALVRSQITTAAKALRRRTALTRIGRRFAERLGERVQVLTDAPVPPHILRAAEAAARDHEVGWRFSHQTPDEQAVAGALARWRAGRAAPLVTGRSVVTPHKAPRRLDVKAVLWRVRLSGPGELSAARSLVGTDAQVASDAGVADFALVAGDAATAVELYRTELAGGSRRPGAWSGFALALDAVAPGPASALLVERPELVRAFCDALEATDDEVPDVGEVAAWLAGPTGAAR
ncbi:HEXXH motif domain-containing protein [Actinosynnema sp. NPDC047251]|uniref:HEXXH motif domain-containing protein n=1 Tax=Saccharothrix espanaensis TaxID=103731 RepID=UPI00059CDA45|nr:HEXXH motif domain-containing protein [Saccharothrix espanaensis]